MSKLFRFLYHIYFDHEQETIRFLYKLMNSQKELCELFSVAAHEEINTISYS